MLTAYAQRGAEPKPTVGPAISWWLYSLTMSEIVQRLMGFEFYIMCQLFCILVLFMEFGKK
jgi:hypothetical protein